MVMNVSQDVSRHPTNRQTVRVGQLVIVLSNATRKPRILWLSEGISGSSLRDHIAATTEIKSNEDCPSWRSSSASQDEEHERDRERHLESPGEADPYLENVREGEREPRFLPQPPHVRNLHPQKATSESRNSYRNENVIHETQECENGTQGLARDEEAERDSLQYEDHAHTLE